MDWPHLCTTRLLDQNFGMCITPQDLILPFYSNGTNYFRPWKVCPETAGKDAGSTVDNTQENFKISLDVQHFQPNEISVKVTDKEITIEGKHEERQDNHGFISRQFLRRYALPRDCLSESVTSTLSSDGILTVMANKILPKITNEKEKIVPIKICEPSPKKEGNDVCEMPKKGATMETKDEMKSDKKDSQVILKEEHCRLMKPELLKDACSDTEKLISESRKETDELMKLMSSDKAAQSTNITAEKVEEALGQCKTAIAELKEKVGETNMNSTTEMSSMKSSMMSETFESKESSSSMSMSSSIKAGSEKTSEMACDIISAELKEAAEYI